MKGYSVSLLIRLLALTLLLAAGALLVTPVSADVFCPLYSDELDYLCPDHYSAAQLSISPPAPRSEYYYTAYEAFVKLHDHTLIYPQPSLQAGPLFDRGAGFVFATITDRVEEVEIESDQQRTWYRISPGQYILAEAVKQTVQPSRFQGRGFAEAPQRPFGWIVSGVYPSSAPDGPPNSDLPFLGRYHFFQVHNAAVGHDGWIWYDVGENRWVQQTRVSLVEPMPRPASVGPGQYWVEVDLYEQSFAAYVGDNLVYAGLVSTGLRGTVTREGLFQVWSRHTRGKMSGGEGTSRYYYLQNVPHILYFDGSIGLHGAYWHDGFGYRASRGCVNMSPRDAEWIFNWSRGRPLWVWVNSSNPHHYFQKYASGEG